MVRQVEAAFPPSKYSLRQAKLGNKREIPARECGRNLKDEYHPSMQAAIRELAFPNPDNALLRITGNNFMNETVEANKSRFLKSNLSRRNCRAGLS
jgi:hypothetical protein